MARAYFRFKVGKQGARKVAPENGAWYLDYQGATGRRVQERCEVAATKADAERKLREAAEKAYRARKGLSVEGPPPILFQDAWAQYLPSCARLASYKDIEAQGRLYLVPRLGRKLLGEMTPADLDRMTDGLDGALAPATRAALLVRVGAVYRWAQRKGRIYRGDNPVQEATKVEVPERLPRFLTLEQLERLFAAHEGSDRFIQLFAVHHGLRKGEIAGLRWDFVDLEQGLITVRYSYAQPRTKGRKDRLVPIHPDLLEPLRALRRTATSPWVFPNPKGQMRTEDGWDAAQNMRAALARAGLVRGYLFRCVNRGRRKSCGYKQERPTKAPARCPSCGMKLWPTALPIDFSFKDLRSTFATHLAELGDLRLVQRLLGHSTPAITERAYAASRTEYLRRGMEGLRLTRDGSGTPPPEGGGRVVQFKSKTK